MTIDKALIVGIGSPQGDDQVGWLVIEELSKRLPGPQYRRAHSPAALLDWLEGIDTLVLCDAVASNSPAGSLHSWVWPAHELVGISFHGTHDLSLVATLQLADELGRLPSRVWIWGVEVSDTPGAAQGISSDIATSVPRLAQQICQELSRA